MSINTLSGLFRGGGRFSNNSLFLLTSPSANQTSQKRTIISKKFLKLPEDYPEPWPYWEKGYIFVLSCIYFLVIIGQI